MIVIVIAAVTIPAVIGGTRSSGSSRRRLIVLDVDNVIAISYTSINSRGSGTVIGEARGYLEESKFYWNAGLVQTWLIVVWHRMMQYSARLKNAMAQYF